MLNELGKVTLIGIGGSGMLPLALLLKEAGYSVQGTDPNLSDKNRILLSEKGIDIIDQDIAGNLEGIQRIVMSPAVPMHHPVLRAAQRIGIEILPRSQVLSELIRNRQTICVAGSHGKSTTTAMLIHIMAESGLPFGHMLGATFSRMDPAYLGLINSPFVLEACEAHGSLPDWHPTHAIVTNIDDEHASHYGGIQKLHAEFRSFINRVGNDGTIILCGDDEGARKLLIKRPSCLTYGFDHSNQLQVKKQHDGKIMLIKDGHCLGALALLVPGQHNLLNATAAYAMATALGVASTTALSALSRFKGVDRRLQRLGCGEGPFIFDDFAHHPTEIAASLTTARDICPGRVIAVLQPQLHSRVRELSTAFAKVLALADRCLVLPVEGLGEKMGSNDTNTLLAQACAEAKVQIERPSDLQDMISTLKSDLRSDDSIVVMAGRSGDQIAQKVLNACLEPSLPNATTASILYGRQTPTAPNLVRSIIDQAIAAPYSLAVQMGSRSLTYGDLMARSTDLAIILRSKGVLAQKTVAVCLGRSIDRVVAFLAILRLGAIYLPIDPLQPSIRLESMLQDSGTRVVIVNNSSPALPKTGLDFVNCLVLKRRSHTPADFNISEIFTNKFCAEALAYLIFTSGTTGRPKGVEISHASLANYATASIGHFTINQEARVSLVSGFGFDVSIGDMAMALAAGACLVLPTDLQATPGAPLARFIAQTRLTHLSITPSMLSVMPILELPDLTTIIVVGETCHQALVDRWAIGRTFINAYGPTEATVEATFYICSPDRPVTIGRPIDNMGACVLDDYFCPVPRGQEGELCLFGEGLARGYLNQPKLTKARFVTVTFPDQTIQRVYRTGDRAIVDHSGNMHCLGRQDDQFKFHGYRIESAEIESVLCSFNQIQDALVSKVDTPNGDRLVAHVVLDSESLALDHAQLKAHLTAHLPVYMHPSSFFPLNDIPRSSNGKSDRSALPIPPSLFSPRNARKPKTPTEKKLFQLVSEFAADKAIYGVRDSLNAAGFDSLEIANLLVSIEAKFGVTLDLSLQDGGDTIEELGLAVDFQLGAPPSLPCQDQFARLTALLRPHLANWPGHKMGRAGLIRCLRPQLPARYELFWCFQSGEEFVALTDALNNDPHSHDFKLYGLRSGHLAFDYDPTTLDMLSNLYADEVESVVTSGPIAIGGNCQGGMIAGEVTKELRRRGRYVCLTILMEQWQFKPMRGQVLLLFGTLSYLNPYGQLEAPEKLFEKAYPDGFRVEMLKGGHGEFFRPENVITLAAAIKNQMKKSFKND